MRRPRLDTWRAFAWYCVLFTIVAFALLVYALITEGVGL